MNMTEERLTWNTRYATYTKSNIRAVPREIVRRPGFDPSDGVSSVSVSRILRMAAFDESPNELSSAALDI